MTRILILVMFLLAAGKVNADVIKIPFSCWSQELKVSFEESGRKLDLSPHERTKDSWGYLENRGSSYWIYTYYSATKEDFEFIMKTAHEIELEQNG